MVTTELFCLLHSVGLCVLTQAATVHFLGKVKSDGFLEVSPTGSYALCKSSLAAGLWLSLAVGLNVLWRTESCVLGVKFILPLGY